MVRIYMIYAVSYGDEAYNKAKILHEKMAYKNGADKVLEYGYSDLSEEFKEEVKDILAIKRGAGCWIWKPYIVYDALCKIEDGDYLIYTDCASATISNYKHLVKAMDDAGVCIMPFTTMQNEFKESKYTKRDTFVLMGLDEEKYVNTSQIWGGAFAFKKCDESVEFVREWLETCKDIRLISDNKNECGLDNYPDFVDHRFDQSIFSLLCKKHGLLLFRDPSLFRRDYCDSFSKDVTDRSPYPQIVDVHRNPNISGKRELTYKKKYLTVYYWKTEVLNVIQRLKK